MLKTTYKLDTYNKDVVDIHCDKDDKYDEFTTRIDIIKNEIEKMYYKLIKYENENNQQKAWHIINNLNL